MTAAANKLGALIGYYDDRMNPIVVRDVRQAVSGRQLSSILVMFLAVQLVVLGGFAFGSDVDSYEAGARAFSVLTFVLVFTCVVVMPIVAAARFSVERSKDDMDLMLITTLTAKKVLWGKINSVQLTMLMIFAAFSPFISLTYLMRGIDLPTIFVVLLGVMLIAYVTTVYAMSVACCGRNLLTRFVAGCFMLGGVLMAMFMAVVFTGVMISGGVGALSNAGFWAGTFMIAMFTFMIVVAAYAVGMDCLRPTGVTRTASERMAYRQRQQLRRRRAQQMAVSREALTAQQMSERAAGTLELQPPVADAFSDDADGSAPSAVVSSPPPLPQQSRPAADAAEANLEHPSHRP